MWNTLLLPYSPSSRMSFLVKQKNGFEKIHSFHQLGRASEDDIHVINQYIYRIMVMLIFILNIFIGLVIKEYKSM